MQDIKASVPPGTIIVANCVFSRKYIADGYLPDINEMPVGSHLLLALEPARDNEDDPLAPGVRIGADLWEMTEAVQAVNDAGYHPMLYFNQSSLRNINLLQSDDEVNRFRRAVSVIGASIPDAPHDMVVHDLFSLNIVRQHWQRIDGAPIGHTYMLSPADPIMRAVAAPAKRQGSWNPDKRVNPLFGLNAIMLNVPMRAGGMAAPERASDIESIATALTRADEMFGEKQKAVLVHVNEFGVNMPVRSAPEPAGEAKPDELTA